jgi:hypothetical protein
MFPSLIGQLWIFSGVDAWLGKHFASLNFSFLESEMEVIDEVIKSND